MVDGLWQGPTALTMDYVNVVRRIKLLGFNAVRLPFSMQVTVSRGQTTGSATCLHCTRLFLLATSAASGTAATVDRGCLQVLFGPDTGGDMDSSCPVFGDVNLNPTSADILASVTHPSTQLSAGACCNAHNDFRVTSTPLQADASVMEKASCELVLRRRTPGSRLHMSWQMHRPAMT